MKWLAATLLGYALALVVQLPASPGLTWVAPGLAGVLYGHSGTAWRGRGQVRIGRIHVDGASWRVRPVALLGGCWEADVRFANGGGAHVRHCADGGIHVRNVRFRIPAGRLLPGAGLPRALAAGDVVVQLDDVSLDGTGLREAGGHVIWRDAKAGIGPLAHLGTVTATVSARSRGLVVSAGNGRGSSGSDVGLSLELELSGRDGWQLAGHLEPNDQLALLKPALEAQLIRLGERLPDGRIAVRRAGRFDW